MPTWPGARSTPSSAKPIWSIADFSEAIRLDPTLAQAYRRSRLCLLVDKGELDKACRRLLRGDPARVERCLHLYPPWRTSTGPRATWIKPSPTTQKPSGLSPRLSEVLIVAGAWPTRSIGKLGRGPSPTSPKPSGFLRNTRTHIGIAAEVYKQKGDLDKANKASPRRKGSGEKRQWSV